MLWLYLPCSELGQSVVPCQLLHAVGKPVERSVHTNSKWKSKGKSIAIRWQSAHPCWKSPMKTTWVTDHPSTMQVSTALNLAQVCLYVAVIPKHEPDYGFSYQCNCLVGNCSWKKMLFLAYKLNSFSVSTHLLVAAPLWQLCSAGTRAYCPTWMSWLWSRATAFLRPITEGVTLWCFCCQLNCQKQAPASC